MHLSAITRIRPVAMLTMAALLMSAMLAGAQVGETTLLFGCDTLDGVSVTGGADWPETELTLNTDEQFVSEGDASIHLSGVSPADATGNSYLSMAIEIDPINLEGQALQFDAWTDLPETTKGLYLRAYNEAGDCVLSFLNWGGPIGPEKTTVTLIKGFGDVLGWEPSMVESDDLTNVTSLRFWIGTSETDAPFGFYVDNIRVGESLIRSFKDVEEPKELFLQTPLVQDGEAARIIAPADEAWSEAASALQSMIEDLSGTAPEITPADQITDEEMRAETAIALGNVASNRRMLYLYSHGYIFPDDYYPGAGGYEVRTVHDPWGTGSNVLSVGASDPAGAMAGIEALRAQLQAGEELVLEPTLLVELSEDAQARWGRAFSVEPDDAWLERLQAQAENDLETGAHTGLFGRMASAGKNYQLSGKDGYARGFAWLAKRAKAHRDTDPQTFGGPWGMDSDFRSGDVWSAWDVVEESPVLTDDDRMEVTRILVQWMEEAVVGSAAQMGKTHPRHNHNTFPSLGCLFAGDYLQKYYDAGEGDRWLEIADDTFGNQSKLFKPHEDCNGYQWLTLYHTLRYCLARPDFTYFENGNARLNADYAILSMDNLAYSVTYGDTGAYVGWWSEMPFLYGAEWYYRDGRYSWATDKKREVSGSLDTGWYATDSESEEPTDLLGTKAVPVEPMYFDLYGGDELMDLEDAVDKVVFRDSFDPQDEYLLLDGLNNGSHGHYDGNSISRMTDNGRIWLADASYMDSLPKYHSTALILQDGQSGPMPGFTEIEHLRDLPSVGFSETALNDYAGVDWHRNIIWLKGDWFVVADEMQAREEADYSFRMLWQTVGDVQLGDDGLTVEQEGQYAAIRMTPELRFTLEHDESYGRNWSGYEFIEEPVVRKLTGIWNGRLEAGEQVTLFTLLHASGESPSPLHLTRLGPNHVAVTGDGEEPTVIAVGGTNEVIPLGPDARITGNAAVVRPGLLALMDATSVEYQGEVLDLYGGQDVQMALGDGEMTIFPEAGRTATPGASSYEEFSPEAAAMSDATVTGMIEQMVATAPPAQKQTVTGASVPELEQVWSYEETLENYLLTGNRGTFGAVDTGVEISAEPAPLEHNVFTGPEDTTNTIDNMLDGADDVTADATMWDDDQPVTVNLDFDRVYEIDSITVKAWFATSSSKNKLFQVQDITIAASDDNFADDSREIVDFSDTEMHSNWGLPVHEPHDYVFADLGTHAQNLRLQFTPRPGTAVYIAEILVRGTGEGIEELALRPDSNVPVHSFMAIHAVDIDGDGADEVVAGSTNGEVYLFESDGSLQWSRDIGGRVNAVSSASIAGQDQPIVVAGGTSAALFAFSAAGDELWSFQFPQYHGTGVVTTIFPADLNADGVDEVVAGTESWRYYAFDGDGTEIWRVESVRMSTVGAAGDLDGDGADEVVAGTEYHSWPVYDSDGTKMFSYAPRTGPGCNGVVIGDITGDDAPEIVFAGLDGFTHAITADGALLWKFGTGDSVSDVALLSGDGGARIAAASRSFNLYGFAGDGTVTWRRDLGSPLVDVAAITTAEGERVVTVAEDGSLIVVGAQDGAPVGHQELRRAGITVTGADVDGDGSQEIVVAGRDGKLTVLR